MKIVYLHQYFTPPHMAGGTRSYSLARRLVEKGHQVHMVTADRNPDGAGAPAWRETEESGITVHWTPVPYDNSMSYPQRIAAFLRFSVRAATKAREIDGDIIFATSTPLTIALPAVYAARRCRIPMVFEVRDLWPAVPIALGALRNPLLRWSARWLERFAYRNSSEIVALAPGMKAAVASTGFPADRITVIPNGADRRIIGEGDADNDVRNGHSWLGTRKLILYCGALGRVNGVGYLARLAQVVHDHDPEIRFAVIGAGAEEAFVRETARTAGVLNKTFFMLGSMPKQDVSRWLNAADLTVALFTGPRIVWKDATQNKFFDSLAAGKPVACNFDGWQCQIAAEEGIGFVLSPDNIEQAAVDLTARLADDKWLAQASAAARHLADTRFSMDAHADLLETVLLRVAARGDPATPAVDA